MMRVLIVGMGYVGLPLAAELRARGHEVHGLHRSANSNAALRDALIVPLQADISRADTLAALPRHFDWVVNCAATGGGSVEDYRALYLDGTRNLLRWLAPAAMPAFRYLYTSSTGVYGQNDGSLVDESSPTSPTSDTAGILIETEQTILNAVRELKLHAMIVRASGIYGPDRAYLLRQFLSGDARIEGVGGRILNMIHRDDLIAAIIAALERGTAGDVFNATDDAPVAQSEFFAWLAAKTGRPMPATLEATTDMTRRRGLTNKRISNRKLRHELRVTLAFPTFREGYSAELARLGIG